MAEIDPVRPDMLHALDRAFAARGVVPDAAQRVAAGRLQHLHDELVAFKHARRNRLRKLLVHPDLPRGVYLWGGVGRGKTLLMDSFFESLPYRRKRRVHFHDFMREMHERLRGEASEADPLSSVAAHIARETRVLCFDEFHVSDIADAMILGRLLDALLESGVVLCLTSNYPPDGLYPNGLQRQNFLPTIELIKSRLDVIEVEGGQDYRKRILEQVEAYHVPIDAAGEALLADAFVEIAGGEGHARPMILLGREVPVRRRGVGVTWFDFPVLCGGPRSQLDYLEITRHCHTVLLSGIPRMDSRDAAAARRFTWLIDILYERNIRLLATAACAPEQLYAEGDQAGEFARTASRLIEMQSREYQERTERAAA